MNLTDIQEYDKKHGTDYVKQLSDITDETVIGARIAFFHYLDRENLNSAITCLRNSGMTSDIITKLREIEHELGQAR